MIVWTMAQSIATGMELSEKDRGRLNLATRRIGTVTQEVLGFDNHRVVIGGWGTRSTFSQQ